MKNIEQVNNYPEWLIIISILAIILFVETTGGNVDIITGPP